MKDHIFTAFIAALVFLASMGINFLWVAKNDGDFTEWPDGTLTVVWCGDQSDYCDQGDNTYIVDLESGPVTWGVIDR